MRQPVMMVFNLRPKTPNIGNDLIGLAADDALRSVLGSDVNLVSVPAAARGGLQGGGLTARTVYEINQLADGVVVGPGNLFENGGLHIDPGALAALSVPLMVLSTSMGRVFDRTGQLVPRTDSLTSPQLTELCAAADPILVRDRATVDHLATLGIDRARAIGCPTLFLDDGMLPQSSPDPELAGAILISVRHPNLMSIPFSAQARLQQDVRGIIDHFHHHSQDVRLLCHDYQDLAFARAFPDVPMMYTEDPRRFMAWLRGCRLNVTFRLHAFLCCLALGTPSIPITYDERAISMLDTLALSEWPVDFLQGGDLLAGLQDRYDRLDRLEELKQLARPLWVRLRCEMTRGIHHFAERMDDHRRSCIF